MGASTRPVRLVLAGVTAAVILAGACSASTDDPAPTTTAAAGGTGTTVGTSPSGSSGTTAPSGTTVTEDIGNDDIRAALEADEPELWALVDYDVMSWDAFGGFTIPVPAGTDVATATELCEAVAEVVDRGGDDTITIASDVSVSNLKGTPIVVRESESATCTAA